MTGAMAGISRAAAAQLTSTELKSWCRAEREAVEQERAGVLSQGLSADDIKSGGWFTKLCAQALRSYTEKSGVVNCWLSGLSSW